MAIKKSETRTELVLVDNDQKAITAIQAKINQWITVGLLIKFDVIPNGDKWLFRILMKKQA